MSSHISRILYNTRERAASTDQNDSTNLHHRALIEALASVSGRQSGVLHGMEVTVLGAGTDVSVSRGLAVLLNPSPDADDSEYQWIELAETTVVSLPAPEGALNRWDVIEISPNDVALASQLRDQFNPAVGTFTPVSVVKRRGSSPTISVTSGTPDFVPELPGGTPGRIPLAYVFVPAAASNLTVGDEIRCRPILIPTPPAVEAEVKGGGISIAPGGQVTFRGVRGRFAGHRHEFVIPDGATRSIGTTMLDGFAFPGSDDVLHLYAVPPPFAAGYDAGMAAREFVPGSSAQTRLGTTGNPVVAASRNCLVIVSTEPPASTTDPVGASSGTGSFTNSFWGTGISLDRTQWVYLGAGFFDQSAGIMTPQDCRGAWVRPTAGTTLVELTSLVTRTLWESTATGGLILPTTAEVLAGRANVTIDSGGDGILNVNDQGADAYLLTMPNAESGDAFYWALDRLYVERGTGEIRVIVSGVTESSIAWTTTAYEDSILAARGA